jgi:predicted transcriptional regulator
MSAASPPRLTRNVLRFPAGTITRLDQIATQASAALGCNVSRSTVARAAIGEWLDAAEQGDPAESLTVIRTAIVRRGRKRAASPPRTAE